MQNVSRLLSRLRKDESGVSLVEWTVMAALIGGVAVTAMIAFSTQMGDAMTSLGTCISAPSSTTCSTPK
jgi:Flp pilus assembly pilin Flp